MRLIYLVCFLVLLCSAGATLAGNDDNLTKAKIIAPKFPGDFAAWLDSNCRVYGITRKYSFEGDCLAQFMIDEYGSVIWCRLKKRTDRSDVDEVLLNILSHMPRWQPAYYRNRPIKYGYILPVIFRSAHITADIKEPVLIK